MNETKIDGPIAMHFGYQTQPWPTKKQRQVAIDWALYNAAAAFIIAMKNKGTLDAGDRTVLIDVSDDGFKEMVDSVRPEFEACLKTLWDENGIDIMELDGEFLTGYSAIWDKHIEKKPG